MANQKSRISVQKASQENSIRGAECLRKLQMENKFPGLVSRDFREGDFRGVCVWFGQGEEEDKVKSEREH